MDTDDYLKTTFQYVRKAGGICVSDEFQIGFGRVGTHFWGFETQGVIPDIVTLGKPIGNGHPLAAVITTPEIAGSFDILTPLDEIPCLVPLEWLFWMLLRMRNCRKTHQRNKAVITYYQLNLRVNIHY